MKNVYDKWKMAPSFVSPTSTRTSGKHFAADVILRVFLTFFRDAANAEINETLNQSTSFNYWSIIWYTSPNRRATPWSAVTCYRFGTAKLESPRPIRLDAKDPIQRLAVPKR